MALHTGQVIYEERAQKIFAVQCINPLRLTVDVAHAALQLVTDAYSVQFEERATGPNRLPTGTIWRHFQPGSRPSYLHQYDRMREYMQRRGSAYFFVNAEISGRTPKLPSSSQISSYPYVGFIKVSPSSHGLQPTTSGSNTLPSCYVNDLVVHPEVQQQGLGSGLTHAAVTAGEYNRAGPLVLDGFRGNDGPNRFFTEVLGLEAQPDVAVPGLQLGEGRELESIRYESPGNLALAGVIRNLESRLAWLQNGYVENA